MGTSGKNLRLPLHGARVCGRRSGSRNRDTSGKMSLVLIKPYQSVATDTLGRLHLGSYASVTEWSSTRLFHSHKRNWFRMYSMLAFQR
jgi:hypothetical protein